MTISELVEKIKEFEGFSSRAYEDVGGTVTIGYGRTEKVKLNDTTTEEKEDEWLRQKVFDLYCDVKDITIAYGFTDNQLFALTDFTFNLGISNLNKLTKYQTRSVNEIAAKILEYNRCRGVTLAGLAKRRKWEQELFIKDMREGRIKSIQDFVNVFLERHNSKTFIDVDGIMGNETIAALQEVFDLLE